MSTPVRITKTRSEVPLIDVDFAHIRKPYLNSGEQINSAYVWEQSGQLDITSVTTTGSHVAFYLSSGSPSNIMRVEVAAITNYGRQVIRSFEMEIVEFRWAI